MKYEIFLRLKSIAKMKIIVYNISREAGVLNVYKESA